MKPVLIGVVVTLVVILLIGGILSMVGQLHFGKGSGMISKQLPGDPPVLVSDGSLHAHSANNWKEPGNKPTATLTPLAKNGNDPSTGSLSANCGLTDDSGNPVPAVLWTDDDHLHPIEAGATIKIMHDPGDVSTGGSAEIDITLPQSTGALTITTQDGSFDPEKMGAKGGKHNRQHSRPGEVQSISYMNPDGTGFMWPTAPATTLSTDPHFTLAFCYQ